MDHESSDGGAWVNGGGAGANCSEYADSGPWLSICQVIDSFNAPISQPPATSTAWNLGQDEQASLTLVSPGYGGPLELPLTYSQLDNHWMHPSPDPDTGEPQHIHAEHSALGNDMLVYDTNLSTTASEVRSYGYTPEQLSANDGHPCFIGVNKP